VAVSAGADKKTGDTAWERRRRLIRRDIEERALELLAERGYDGVSTEELAAAAGVSTRTFFRYFATKDDLLMAMPQRVAESLCASAIERPREETLIEAWRAVATGADSWRHPEDLRTAVHFQRMLAKSPGLPNRIIRNGVLLAPFVAAVATRLDVDPENDLRPEVYGAAIRSALHVAVERWASDEGRSPLPTLFSEALDILTTLPTAGGSPSARKRRSRRS
jgi:AcrR family transcriptional regulator